MIEPCVRHLLDEEEPLLLPLLAEPVSRSSMVEGERLRSWLFNRLATPATWGVAMEVPHVLPEGAPAPAPIDFGYLEYALERLDGFYIRAADIDTRSVEPAE